MGTILGRADDMLIIRGVNLFHTQVEAVISFFGQLSPSYQLIVSREGAMDGVEVKVELEPVFYRQLVLSGPWTEASANNPALYALHHELTKKIKDNIGLSMKITLCEPGSIPRSEGGKLSRVVDLRK